MIRFAVTISVLCQLYFAPWAVGASSTRGKELLRDGTPYIVKGVHYGPWRPGTGPGKNYSYPTREQVASDLRLIKSLSANSISVYDPPDYVLDVAPETGLHVLYVFFSQWWTIGSPEGSADRHRIVERVRRLKHHPALLGWVLGNEIPITVIEVRGKDPIERGLKNLYTDIKAADPSHIVTHANWPNTRDLHLNFF